MIRALERTVVRAMGTICTLAASAGPDELADARLALDAAQHEIEACEHAMSRFDPESDLSWLNREHGSWVVVDPRLADALTAALRARRETHGRFDPTILPALLAAGYDRSFELVAERAAAPLEDWHAGATVEVDAASGRARVERGAAVDLGGIGKGFSATRAVGAMRAAWPDLTGAVVDLGGDVAVWGDPPEGGPWRIDIADPRAPDGVIAGTLGITSGGIATSGRDTRRFGPGRSLHHLIDPATGASAAEGPLSVTVVATSATEAEAHATALAISSVEEAVDYVAARPGLSALLIPQAGEPIALGPLPLVQERPQPTLVIDPRTGRFTWQ